MQGPSGPVSGSRLVGLLRNQLLREKSDYLLFRVLRVDTVREFRSDIHERGRTSSCDATQPIKLFREKVT